MERVIVKTQRLENFRGELPAYQSPGASGMDVRAQLREPVSLAPGQRALVPTGLTMEIPLGYEIQVRPRSGLAAKQGIMVVNSPGTVDADYRGEIKIILANMGTETFVINDQERVAQLVLCPVVQAQLVVADQLSATERGAGGFGSTGVTGGA